MMHYLGVDGPGLVVYEGETMEQAEARKAMQRAHNDRMNALYADWQRQRAMPMRSMIAWAAARGLLPTA